MTSAPDDCATGDLGAPLAGRSILVTRTREQAHALIDPLEALGAEVLAMPVLETVDPEDWAPVDASIRDLDSYDWLVLTSTNGVDRFLRRFKVAGGTREALLGLRIAAVGSATAEKLARHGLPPVLVPADFRAEGLVEAFRAMGAGPGWRILLPRAEEAREILPDTLRELGCHVDVVSVYRTRIAVPEASAIARLKAGTVDTVTLTSGAIAGGFISAISAGGLDPHEVMDRLTVASIGPVTTDELERLGYTADVEASEATMSSLVAAVAAYLSGHEYV